MKKSKFKKVCLIASAFLAVSAIALGAILPERSISPLAETIEWASEDIPSKIALGQEISLPENIEVEYKGENYTASGCVIERPDGRVVEREEKLSLNLCGTYTIKYFFTANDKQYIAERKITVYNEYFGFSVDNGSEMHLSDADDTLWSGKDGLVVNVKEGAEFVYNKPVDLRNAGADGLTSVIELDSRLGSFDDDGTYQADAAIAWVKLTDCYNPAVSVELRMARSADYSGALFTGVKTTYQECAGLDPTGWMVENLNRIVNIDGIDYKLWPNENGYANEDLPNLRLDMNSGVLWKYDYDEMRFYIEWQNYESHKKLVIDLDDTSIYNSGNIFPGWTTGEVYVSVYAEEYSNASARNEIISIGGESVKSLYTENRYVDDVAPEITIDAEKTSETGIYGAVGDRVTIPTATATDVNLVGDVSVAVYRGYGTASECNVSVVDNSFLLSKSDLYTIVYTAKDGAGNVAVETFTVEANATAENRAVTLKFNQFSALNAGEQVDLSYRVTEALNCAIDDVKVKIYVNSERESFVYDEACEFIPRYAGEYEIVYEYTDGVFTYRKQYTVRCGASDAISFYGEMTLPRYFVKGFNYSLEGVKAYSYWRGEPSEYPTDVYVVYDGGSEQKVNDLAHLQVEGNESAYFVFKAGGLTQTSDVVPIVDATYTEDNFTGIDMSKLFVGDFTANAESGGQRTQEISFVSNAKKGNNTLSFVNAISYRSFAFSYKIDKDFGNYSALKLILRDKTDATKAYTIEILNKSGLAYVSLNGGAAMSLGENYTFTSAASHTISYTHATHKMTIDKNTFTTEIALSEGECYLDIELVDVTGDAGIKVLKINRQSISGTLYADNASPEIYIDDTQGEYAVGAIVPLRVPEFSDVLSGVDYSTVTFTVACNDGKPALDANGNPLTNLEWDKEYSLLLDRITSYIIDYTVKDFSGRRGSTGYTIYCVDTTAPTVTLDNLNEGDVIRIKAGGEVNINFTISDDVSAPVKMKAYIHLYCDDMFTYVANVARFKDNEKPTDGKYYGKFNIPVKGKYTAQIHVYDEKGNHTQKNVTIVVE